MKKELEDYLWDRIGTPYKGDKFPRDVIDEMLEKKMINSPKQAWRTLEKWVGQGIYEYGVCLDLGWKVL